MFNLYRRRSLIWDFRVWALTLLWSVFALTPLMAQDAVQVAGTATVQSAQTGDWTNPSTWVGNQVPGTDARVLINNNHTVTVNTTIGTEFKSVRIANGGILSFPTTADSELRTEYLVSQGSGTLQIGTSSTPVAANRTARIVFADRGGTTQSQDPSRFAPGAVLMGPVRMYGAQKTAWLPLATKPGPGATQLVLSSVPIGWRAGDQLVVAGVDPNDYKSDESVTISSISGNTVTLTSALTKNHIPPAQIANLVDVHVSNNTRNIQISSENPLVTAKSGTSGFGKPRGHMMFMHNSDVIVKFVEATNTGRTDKSIELDDWEVPDDETLRNGPYPPVAGGGKNPRGRYSFHFHRTLDFNTNKAILEGCVVNNDPGWGFVSHTSNVDFKDNVAYDVVGSSFCTEAGDELGSFIGNIAIRTVNNSLPMDIGRPSGHPFNTPRNGAVADQREGRSDFAWQGDGFWFHSAGVTVENNVVSGSSGHGFVYWADGLFEPNRGRPTMQTKIDLYVPPAEFPTLNQALKDHRAANPGWIFDVWYLLPRPFKNNEVYSAARGIHAYYIMTEFHEAIDPTESEFNLTPPTYRDAAKLVIEDSKVWSMKRIGIGFTHCAQVTLKNNQVYGYGTSTSLAPWNQSPTTYPYLEQEPHSIGMDLDHYHNTRNWKLENNTVVGFDGQAIGVTLPTNGSTTINGGTFDNSGIDIKIREVNWRKNWNTSTYIVNASDTNFDPLPKAPWNTTPWRNITIQGNIQFNNSNQNIVLDPQFHLTNPAQDGFPILDGDVKMTGYFMLPDNIVLNFGPFSNSKVYFDEQRADFIAVSSSAFLTPREFPAGNLFPENTTPNKYLNKTNQQLRNQYGASLGGEITPAGTQSHPILIGGTATNVGASNQAPTVSITSPANNADFSEGSNVVINANAADADGSVTKVEFFQGSTKLGEDTTSPYSYTWNSPAAGAYVLTAVATDNGSATTTSGAVNITVTGTTTQYTLTTNAGVGGTVNPSGSNNYNDGTIVQVAATPNAGYQFDGWSGSETGTTNPIDVTMNANKTLTANFSQIPVGSLNAEGGSITVSTSGYTTVNLSNAYTSPVVVATPVLPTTSTVPVVTRVRNVAGSSFQVKVQNPSGTTVNGIEVQYLVVEAGTYTVAANGVKMEAKTVTSSITGRKNGWTLETESYNQSYTNPVVLGQVMSANDANWSVFYASSSSRTSPPTSSALRAGKHVAEDTNTGRANETVGLIIIEAGSGSFDGISYQAGVGSDIVRGTQNSTSGYNYSHGVSGATGAILSAAGIDGGDGGWPVLLGGSAVSGSAVTMAFDEDQVSNSERSHTTEQVAYMVFADGGTPPVQYTLTTNAGAGGSVSAGGTYNSGTIVQVTATPNAGYQFDGWTGDASGTTNPVDVTMDGNKTVTASFSQIPPTQYTLTTNASAGGSVTAGGTYNAGQVVNITATPNAGFQFDGWTGDASGTTNPLPVTMDANKTITATFSSVGGGNDCSGLTYNDYLGAGHASGVSASASSVDDTATPIKTVNANGLSGGSNGTHNTTWNSGWIGTQTSNAWIQYNFGAAYPLGQMHVWNGNEDGETDRGINAVTVTYSTDGTNFTTLGNYVWTQATGAASYAGFAGPDFGGVNAQYVRITANSNFGDEFGTALAEVRFDLQCAALRSAPASNPETEEVVEGIEITLYPNPTVVENVNIQLTGIEGAVEVTLLDLGGKLIKKESIEVQHIRHEHQLDLSGLPSGSYIVNVEHSSGHKAMRLIKN